MYPIRNTKYKSWTIFCPVYRYPLNTPIPDFNKKSVQNPEQKSTSLWTYVLFYIVSALVSLTYLTWRAWNVLDTLDNSTDLRWRGVAVVMEYGYSHLSDGKRVRMFQQHKLSKTLRIERKNLRTEIGRNIMTLIQ